MRELVFEGQLKGHKTAVIGVGKSGKAAVKLLAKLGAEVYWLEQNQSKIDSEVEELSTILGLKLRVGKHSSKLLSSCNLVVLSPGVRLNDIKPLVGANTLICAEMELAFWFVDKPIIAITGTNGKTTTTLILSHVLKKAGYRVFSGGNLGTPLSEYVLSNEEVDYLVLEVSSFQLQGCLSFRPNIGIWLNFAPNHLDFHQDLQEYFAAKLNLFLRQKKTDVGIFHLDLKPALEKYPLAGSKVFFVARNKFEHSLLLGKHNQENLEAAFLAVNQLGISENDFQKYIYDFVPLEHRLEIFWQDKGVVFINDSKSTTIYALRAALESVPAPVRLFCGGVFKGGDLNGLGPLLSKVKKVYLFGQARDVFEPVFKKYVEEVIWKPNLESALRALKQDLAQEKSPKETVLLSPATASFDLFANYEERGKVFKKLVQKYFPEGRPFYG